MFPRRSSLVVLTIATTLGLLISGNSTAQAKSLVGTICTKLGAKTGDGPGRTLICTQKGKKKIWQVPPAPNSQKKSSPSASPSPSPSCQKRPEFTSDFIDSNYVRDVTPIGEQTGSGGVIAVRSYIHPKSDLVGKELPIFAPVDMTLTSASYYKPLGAPETYQPEYSLYFEVSCGINVKFFHIKGVVGKVAAAVPATASSSSAGQQVKSTSVKAGEQIGWYKLGENSVAFDFWVDDLTHTNSFIVPSHFASSNALHSVCPYDFYSASKKSIWLAKLGAPGSDPIPGTGCGVVDEGTPGTADGMWFIAQNTQVDHLVLDGPYQSQIMFSLDPSGIIRIGGLNTSSNLSQMMVSPQSPTWKKPSDVVIAASHCWSNDTQSVSVTVISNTTMSVVVGTGTCASLPNATTGKMYFR